MKPRLQWVPREPPLPPRVAVASGAAVRRTIARLLAFDDAHLASVSGVAEVGADGRLALVALRGPSERLPWVDGIRYFGEAPEAPGVFLSTVRQPSDPTALWLRALRQRYPDGPLIWLPEGGVVPLAAARPVDRSILRSWPQS